MATTTGFILIVVVILSCSSSTPPRGGDAIKDIGILEKYGGVLVHDCWNAYFSYTDITHALCVAHLLRELKFVEDSTGSKWATNLKKLL